MAKREMEAQYDRGYSAVDGHLCIEHVVDEVLKGRLQTSLTSEPCDFCNDITAEAATVPVEDVVTEVVTALRYYYRDAAELPAGLNDMAVSDANEAVQDICSSAFSDDVYDAVVERLVTAIGWDKEWTSWGGAADVDHFSWQWTEYAEVLRTTSRFDLIEPKSRDPDSVWTPPQQVASFLGQLLIYVDGPLGLVRPLPAGSSFYRGRLVEFGDNVGATAEDLGPAPSGLATANRMSPAGVSLLYASEDAATAIAEIAGHGVKPMALVGRFRTNRNLDVLDLTEAPIWGSPFSDQGRTAATMAHFLKTFVDEMTRAVIPDGRQHVAYVPTQVLTEYLRWVPDTKIDGIALPSRQTGRKTYVMFFGPGDVSDTASREPVKLPQHLAELQDDAAPGRCRGTR